MGHGEHPFVKTCGVMFKEKYPDKESAIPEGSPLVDGGIPEDVMTEALRRYYAGKTLVIVCVFRYVLPVRPQNRK
jgi:hypothetical protein